MNRSWPILLVVGCLAGPSSVLAGGTGGLNIAWGTGCFPENPTSLRTFACGTNSGSATFVVSFSPGLSLPFSGISAQISIASESSRLPDWWQLRSTGCRGTSLSVSTDFAAAPQFGCTDPWGAGGTGAWSYQTRATSPLPANVAILHADFTPDSPFPMTVGTEYYGVMGTINYTKTVGAGACAGCGTEVALTAEYVIVQYSGGISEFIVMPIANYCIFWQGTSPPCLGGVVPARATTWGQLKSLYR